MLLTKSRIALWRLSLVVTGTLLSGCGITYVTQAARGQLAVMRAREPIEKVLQRPQTSESLRTQLTRAQRIRAFASAELGLPDNAAFRSYADIRRPYVVWNVVAVPPLSISPRQWCFPVVGCVSYRGYFSEAAARSFAATLRSKGDDVVVGGVPAYSTLGRTADPLLNTVGRYGELDLAALVFHELAHQVVYLPGDSSFNEAFATAVEQAGVARYAAQFSDDTVLARWRARRAVNARVVDELIRTRAELGRLYARSLPDAEKLEQKSQRLAALVARVRDIEKEAGISSGYGGWLEAGVNNAHLASVATYYDQVPRFEALLQNVCGGYLPCFYVEARREADSKRKGPGVGVRPSSDTRAPD